MAIDSGLNSILTVIALPDASKNAIDFRLSTIKDLEDLFTYLADDKAKVEATLRLIADTTVVTDIDICRLMFIFDCFIVKIVDPNFAWTDFTQAVYVADKWARAVTTTTPVSRTIDFSADILLTGAKPPTPGTTGTFKPHKLWKSPFVATSRNSSNVRQLHNTDLVPASSKPLHVITFYRKLVVSTKPAEIDVIHFAQFDPDCALWPMNHCADIVF
jgi:hypothetical protein